MYKYATVYKDTPLGRFSKLDFSTSKRLPIPDDASSESSRRDVPNAGLSGADISPTAEISSMENRPRRNVIIHRRIRVPPVRADPGATCKHSGVFCYRCALIYYIRVCVDSFVYYTWYVTAWTVNMV